MTGAGIEVVAARKIEARAWFQRLRDYFCAAFEALEDELAGANASRFAEVAPGRFERKAWQRPDGSGGEGGGGVMATLRGRVFAKVGVNVSTVFGRFSPAFARQIPGAVDDRTSVVSGKSVSVRVDIGGGCTYQKRKKYQNSLTKSSK